MNWLFNFSASPAGGGLVRLRETAKWFDGHGGATFLVHAKALEAVSRYSNCNRHIGIQPDKLRRLFADGNYLPGVIRQIGVPDVYFSYGIPLFYSVARINWLHVSNALTLTRDRYGMPFRRHFEHQLLGKRLVRSLKHAHIASAESEFALGLLRMAKGNTGSVNKYVVIDNGCADDLFDRQECGVQVEPSSYAVTIGTAPYKRLEQALAVFGALQRSHPSLDRFKVVGDRSQIPRKVLRDGRVDALGSGIESQELYSMLERAKYYISTSGIENSSVAATEAMLLCENVVLSNIPSHREAVRDTEQVELCVSGVGVLIEVIGPRNKKQARPPSWSDVLQRMSDVASEFARSRCSSKSR